MARQEGLPLTESKKPRFVYGYIVVFAAFIMIVLAWGTFFSFGIFFNPLLIEFGWTRAVTSGAFTLASLILGFLSIVTGRLSDRFGSRIVATICGFILGLGFILMSQISAIWQLYLFYGVIVATGIAGCWAPLIATVARLFVNRRGLMIGIVTSGVGLGTVIIPLVAARLISSHGWRTSYIILGIIVLVLIISAAQFLRRAPRQIGQLPYDENEIKQESLASEARGFSLVEASHTRQFWMSCVMYFCFGFFSHTITVHIVPHATELGIPPISAANILAIIGGLGFIGRIIVGSASDRIGIKSSLIFVFILVSAVLFWLQLAEELWMLYLFAVIYGFTCAGLSALQSLMAAELFGLGSLGIIVGSLTFSFTTGGAIGALLAGHIFDITESYYIAFLVCAILSIVGFMLALFLRPVSNGGEMNDSRRSP